MDHFQNIIQMLELMLQPAFAAKDGRIVYLNQAAQSCMLENDSELSNLILSGQDEYAQFSDGCLYLTLTVAGHTQNASVTRIGAFDIFLLEQASVSSDLQALALAARELREPLANTMFTADRLLPVLSAQDPPELRAQAEQLNRGLYQMLRLIGNMSDAARYTNPEAAPRSQVRNITAVLDEIFQEAAHLTEEAGVQLIFSNLKEELFCPINTEMLERAVYNIISNALKVSPKGSTIQATLTRSGKRLRLTVQDSGPGIPAAQRSSIYFRYLRKPELEDSANGIGLGMVLICAAARAHGGTVLLECPEGHGTRITMTFSISAPPAELRSPALQIDYAGGRSHGLIELSGQLPAKLYSSEN